ncbi:hypothetical protein N9J72_00235 [Candidatus Gracilibacteria bacterium]|nr:hypothetical protein [Candidatus Gracilibacteria bacterium]
MHDIKIFLEDNGSFGAVATLGKEKIYSIGNSRNELIDSLKEGIQMSNEFSTSAESEKFSKFLQV